MADDDPFDFLPQDWSAYERELWTEATESFGMDGDRVAQALFNEAYFNFDLPSDQISTLRDAFDSYMFSEYGIDFDEIFDWEAYREAYGELS